MSEWPLPPPDGFAHVRGTRLEYRFIPPLAPGGAVMVFMHEGLGCVQMWRDFPDQLCARTGLGGFVFSRAGYGRSDPAALPRSPEFMHDEAVRVLPELLQQAAFERVVHVGHSDGATIALLNAALDPPDGLAAVVAMAPHVFVEDVTVEAICAAARAYRDTDLRARLSRYHGERVDGAFWGWNQVWRDASFASWNVATALNTLRSPLMLVQGHDDAYGTMAQLDAIAANVAGPVERLALRNCGHSPHRDQAELVLTRIAEFLQPL